MINAISSLGAVTFCRRMFLLFFVALTAFASSSAVAQSAHILVIPTNSAWRLFRGTNEASTPPTLWRTNTFDDSSWELAPAPFFYNPSNTSPGGAGTLLSDMQSNYTCIFLRQSFVLTNAQDVIALSNRPFADDGFIIWLNGYPIRAFDMPGGSAATNGFMPFNTNANVAAVSATWFNLTAYTNLLRTGTNVIAFQGFNVARDDADYLANPEVAIVAVDRTPLRVASATPPFGATVNDLTNVTVVFNRRVTGVSVDDFRINGQPPTSFTGSNTTYTFHFPTPLTTNVAISWDVNQVILDEAGNRFDESESTWSYTIVDVTAPSVSSVTPAAGSVVGSLGQILVRFNEPVLGVDASDLLVNGTPAVSAFGSGAGPYTFEFGATATGAVQIAWSAGHGIRDTAPAANAFGGGSWTVTLNPAAFTGDVIINEFAAANLVSQGALDFSEFNVPEDWIELYNRGANPVRLLGWSLTDNQDQPGLWTFPDVTIAPGQYLVVYASGLDRRVLGGTNRLHTNFKLNPFGKYLGLFNAEFPRRAVSEFAPEYPEQRNDYSYGVVGSNTWRYFATPTPGQANGSSTITQVLPRPSVNVSRGYFFHPFQLVATSEVPGTSLRYTTDGSEPTEATGFAYAGPLTLSNSTVLRIAAFGANALPSRATTHSYIFVDSIFRQSNNPGTNFPNTFGTQNTFVSPSDYEMDPEILTNALYTPFLTNALLALPAVSIVIKPADMWDTNTGIYTHPLSRGTQWERPASMEFFTPDDSEEGFQIEGGLQIQGNASREPLKQPKHPLKMQFKGDYGPANLNYKLFHDSPRDEFDSVNIRVDFNFSWLHWDGNQRLRGQRTRDAWMKDSMRALGGLASHNRYAHLFINGLYWGVCDPTERPDGSFAAAYLGGDKDEYDVVNEGLVVDGDRTVYNQMLALPQISTTAQYDTMKQYLEMTQFMDYMMLHFFVGHEDWGFDKNWYTMRRRGVGNQFWYVPWDGENILGTDVNRNDTTRPTGSGSTGVPSGLHTKLVTSPQYRMDFADRVHRAFFNNGPLMPSNNITRWMNRARQVDLPIILESARWGDYRRDVHVYQTAPYELYTRNNQWLNEQNRLVGTYFPQRSAIVLQQLRAQGLYPSNTAPAFNQHGGRVAPGFQLTMSATNTIYYTTNGSDPRLYGSGGVSPLARVYSGPIGISQTMVVKARMLVGTNWSALNEATFTVGSLATPLRITELMYNPIGGDAYEFLELQNTGPTPVNLGNHYFQNINFIFPFGYTLGAGDRIVLGNNANTNEWKARYPGVTVAGWFGGSLANGGETLTLLDESNRVVLSVSYDDENGWATAADGGGSSLELVNFEASPDEPAHWRASSNQNGTPGAAAQAPTASAVVLNEVLAENLSAVNHEGTFPDFIELHNMSASAVSLAGWSLSDDGNTRKFVFQNGTSIPAGGYLVVWADSITNTTSGLHAGFGLGRNGDSVFLYDANTNRVDAISFGPQAANYSIGRVGGQWVLTTPTPSVANTPAALAPFSALAINEWLANAAPGSEDWIELFNTSASAPIALRGTYLGTSNALFQITSLAFIAPRGYLQIFADENAGADHVDFKLPANGGAIVFYDNTAAEVQRVTYGAQLQGVSQGRLPDGSATIATFANSVSPGSSNYVISYSGPFINELLARNASAVAGPWGNYADFIELRNTNATAFDLSGMGLSDDDKVKFTFPPGTSIPGNSHLVIWCSGDHPASTTPHFNSGFSLSSQAGGVYLFNAQGQVVNAVEYGPQARDFSIGLSGGTWQLLSTPTPAGVNSAAAALGSPTNVKFNEWMASPTSGDDWFELYNSEALPVALAGLILSDTPSIAGLSNTPIAALTFIGPKDWLQWFASATPSAGPNHTTFSLDADGDTLRLYAANLSILDTVSFGAQVDGASQGRLPDGGSNIVSFATTATPEASNYLPLNNIVINEALTHTDLPFEDAIELQNVSAGTVNIGGWWISNSERELRKFRVPAGVTLTPGAFRVFYEANFNASGTGTGTNFTLNSSRGDTLYVAEADANGNLTGYRTQVSFGAAANGVSFGRFNTSLGSDFVAMAQRTFGVDNPASVAQFRTGTGVSNSYPRVGPVIINEVMYRPSSGVSNATENSDEEFIELLNVTGAPVPLFDPAHPANGWRLDGGVTFQFTSNHTLAANAHLVLVGFDPATNTAAVANFQAKYGSGATLVGPYRGRLGNEGEELALSRPDNPQQPPAPNAGYVPMILVDRIVYSPTNNWPAAANGGGASLQRLASALYGNEPLNWKAEPATAGRTNSQAGAVAPTINTPPQSITVVAGATATFTIAASGTAPLSYQWQRSNTNLPGATGASLEILNVQPGDAGTYRVIVSNSAGSVPSQAATLTVLVPPSISQPPLSQTVVAGTTVQFTASASGTAPLRYQWRFNGSPIDGETDAQLTLNNVQPASAGNYTVVITNIAGAVTSSVASLTINVAPAITSDPSDLTVAENETATFNVSATGTAPLYYQWRKDGVNIPGANGPSFSLLGAHPSDEGAYSVLITNVAGSAISAAARLRVNSQPFLSQPKLRPDGAFEFTLQGQTNRLYAVEFSVSLTGWTNLTNITLNVPQSLIVDRAATNSPHRFYRVRLP
jgi:hypothetical protein